MNGKDIFLGLRYVDEEIVERAEFGQFSNRATKESNKKARKISRPLLIAAIIAGLLALVGCGMMVAQRIRLNYVQNNVPAQTETVAANTSKSQAHVRNVLTDCYPQQLPDGYEIWYSGPLDHQSRNIQFRDAQGNLLSYSISTRKAMDIALAPNVEITTIDFSWGTGELQVSDRGAQALQWHNETAGYYAGFFTQDLDVDLVAVANSVAPGDPVPLSAWYRGGELWNPWYPQQLPGDYVCTDVAPITNGLQSVTFENGSNGYIRFVISTEAKLMPEDISEAMRLEEITVHGEAANLLRNQDAQRTLFWKNKQEGFYALLETTDTSVDLIALAESVAPGEPMEVSDLYLGPDYTLELEQEPTTYIEWQSIYPQSIPEGYKLAQVGDKAYGEQHITWENNQGDEIDYTLYFRVGSFGRQFEGSGTPEIVDINGKTGYLNGKQLLWADEELGFAYKLRASGEVDLIALAKSVGLGPELMILDNHTEKALNQLGDYRITQFPENMVEDSVTGWPLENSDDWYSYVRRWYFNKENNNQIYFTYETYITDLTDANETLRLYVSGENGLERVTIQGHSGITQQEGNRAKVVWIVGDAAKGVSFQLYSEQFTVEQLLTAAESVQQY